MKKTTVEITGASEICFSRFHNTPKEPKELPIDYEERTWQQKAHVQNGIVCIPGLAFKNCISEAAKYLSIQIAGKGKATYTKHFEAGIAVFDEYISTGISIEQIVKKNVFVPSDGKRGSGSRVMRSYPSLPTWKATVDFVILDEIINKEVFEQVIKNAGMLIGIGTFRVRNNGMCGRFVPKIIEWVDDFDPTKM